MFRYVFPIAILNFLMIVGCHSPSWVGSTSSQPFPPPSKKVDPAADIPAGCKHECVASTANCQRFSKDLFLKYPNQLHKLYIEASQTAPGDKGTIDLGENNVLDFTDMRLFQFKIVSTAGVQFERGTRPDLVLEILNPDSAPELQFQNPQIAKDFFGRLRTIEFIDQNPVFQFDQLNCIAFQ